MSMLNLTPNFEIPALCSIVMTANSEGVYLYAGKNDAEEAEGTMNLLDDRHATKVIPWSEIYRYDDVSRDEFIKKEWFALLDTI